MPSPYLLVRATEHRDEKLQEKKASGAGTSCRKERRALSLFLQGTEATFPSEAPPDFVAYANERVANTAVHDQLQSLFAERPIWTKQAVCWHTGLPNTTLKGLLGKFAFYISSGPWGRVWCRYGFDPRRDPSAVKFQTIMVSFKNNALISPQKRLRLGPQGSLLTGHSTPTSNSNGRGGIESWRYIRGEMPGLRQCFFCLCDVDLPEAIAACNPSPAAVATDLANPTTGFLHNGLIETIRTAIQADTRRTEARLKAADAATPIDDVPFPELLHPDDQQQDLLPSQQSSMDSLESL